MSSRKSFLFWIIILILSCSCLATTYIVKKDGTGDYTEIQDAVDASSGGDTIIVYPGLYCENISISYKDIILTGSSPEDLLIVEQTIVDANDGDYGISVISTDENMVISGLSITGAKRDGIILGNSEATVKNCILENNANGIRINWSYGSVISNNFIRENSKTGAYPSDNVHAGIRVTHAWGIILNNMIYSNKCGIHFDSACTADSDVYNNTIVNHDDYGIYSESTYMPVVTNCIIWDCNDDLYGCSAIYSCIQDDDSGNGNIQTNPIFLSQFSDEDLVSWWRLDEETGTTAYDSVGSNDGSVYGNPARSDGPHSGAFVFDGVDDYINCGSDSTLDITEEITVSTWIKLDEKKHSFVVAKRDGDDTQYALYLYFSATSPAIYFFINGESNILRATNSLVTGQWHHLAVSFDGSVGHGHIYLNGDDITVDTEAAAIVSDPNCPLYIGSCGNGSGGSDWRRFKGSIDDVKIYNRALSTGEIGQLYQYDITEETDYHLSFRSPCLNVGDPNTTASSATDIDNEPRIIDGIEMGCDELNMFSMDSMHFGGMMSDNLYSRLYDSQEKFQYLLPRYIWSTVSEDANDLDFMVDHLHTLRQDVSLGYHFHPTNATWSDEEYYPACPAWLHIEDFNDIHPEWILRDSIGRQISYQDNFARPYLNITDPNVRAEIVSEFIQRTVERNLDALNYDNLLYGLSPDASVVSEEDWLEAIYALLNETKDVAKNYGLEVFGNIGCNAGFIADAFKSYVDNTDVSGLCMEMAFHRAVRTDAGLAEEIEGYEYALQHGRKIVLFVFDGEDKSFAIGKIRPLAEKYDNIYLIKKGSILNPTTLAINDEMACLDIYSETLLQNSCFTAWDSNNDPNGWIISGENGTTRKVMEMGYFVTSYYNVADPNNYNMMQNQTNFGDSSYKPTNGYMNTSYGIGACNLYAASGNISLSQNIFTIPGNTYRYSMFIGQAKLNDDTLFGKIIVSVISNGTVIKQENYSTYGVKTFTFTADSLLTCIKISNDLNETGTTDITFDDVAVWNLNSDIILGPVYNLSTQTSYQEIQSAIDEAEDGDEIVVYPGTYYEDIDFIGKAITLRSVDPNDCYITEATVIDANDAYHAVSFVNNEEPNSILSGFTITGGYANGTNYDDSGAGIFCNGTSPTIQNCIISGNIATQYGGGIYLNNSSAQITNCIIEDNSADDQGGGIRVYDGAAVITSCQFNENDSGTSGGGLSNNNYAQTRITNCTFYQNAADEYGGAMYNTYSSAVEVENCIFQENSTPSSGGAVQNTNSNISIINSLFFDNNAKWGGAMHNDTSSPTITNCTFTQNQAIQYSGAGGSGGAMRNYDNSDPVITNCILWDDTAQTSGNEISNSGASDVPVISYSDVEGYSGGTGNINSDPNFVDPANNDFHITSNSPCIDVGKSSLSYTGQTDIDGDDRVIDIDGKGDGNNDVDMGADEYNPD